MAGKQPKMRQEIALGLFLLVVLPALNATKLF